jgi:hypothetical protein
MWALLEVVYIFYMVLSVFFGAVAPTDALSFESSLLPLLHILTSGR